jgi:magnesium-transporting ATPase (P-type)
VIAEPRPAASILAGEHVLRGCSLCHTLFEHQG